MQIALVSVHDNLELVCAQLNATQWGDDNEMAAFTPEALARFISNDHNLYVVGRVDNQIVCCALAYVLNHPDTTRRSLYVDELDTHPDHRRKGYAAQLLAWLRTFAEEHELREVWLATETEDNQTANAFYESQQPTEKVPCNIYSYSAKKL